MTVEDDRRIDPVMRRLADGIFGPSDLHVYARYMKPVRQPIDWGRTALLVVDTSEAFVGRDVPTTEAVAERRTACGSPAWRAVEQVQTLLTAYRNAGLAVVFTIPDLDGEVHYGGTTIGVEASAGERDSLAAGLARRPAELLLRKARASAFFGTPLLSYFVRNSISGIVLAGGTTSGCVRATAVDASSGGLDVVLVPEACFDRSDISHRVSAFELATKYVRLASPADVVAALVHVKRPRDRSGA